MWNNKKLRDQEFDRVPDFKYGAWRQKQFLSSDDEESLKAFVQGANKYKYMHNRPAEDSTKKEDKVQSSDVRLPAGLKVREYEPLRSSSVGIQTDYRENETQTEPWDPPCNLKLQAPELEVLTLTYMKYGAHLPIDEEGLADIVEDRAKRNFEAQIPQKFECEDDLKKFHKLIVEQKVREVTVMKSKVKKYFEKQLALKQAALMQEIKMRNERKDDALDRLWDIKKDELVQKTSKLREQFARRMKRLEEKQQALVKKHKKLTDHFDMDLLQSAGDSGNIGIYGQDFSEHQPGDFYLDSAKGLSELEKWLWEEQKIVMEPEIFLPKLESRPTRLERMMDQTQKELSEMRAKRRMVMVQAERRMALEKPKQRPATPSVKPIPQEVLDRNHTAVVLQKTLVGRAVQKQVTEMYNNYSGLTEEIRNTHGVLENEQALIDQKTKAKIQQYLELKAKMRERSIHEEIISRFEGKTISEVLNVMGQAVNRYQEWQEVEKIVQKAKDERRRREAVEGGRRQKELHLKDVLDIFVDKVREDQNKVIEDLLNSTFAELDEERRNLEIKNVSRCLVSKLRDSTVDEEEKRNLQIKAASRCLLSDLLDKTIDEEEKEKEREIQEVSHEVIDDFLDKVLSLKEVKTDEISDELQEEKSEEGS